MSRGFSLVELVLALLLLEIGVLATVGMFVLAQQNLRRAELTLRGVLEARVVGDSLAMVGTAASGKTSLPWGELLWSPVSTPVQGLRVSAWVPLEGDTLAAVLSFPPLDPTLSSWPDSLALAERRR